MKKFHYVVCGGTFDHLHKGHREFLKYQFGISENVLIGLTSDAFGIEKDSSLLPFAVRKKELEEFLKAEGLLRRVCIAKIDNAYIPTEFEKFPIDAIVVTQDTEKGADLINKKREKDGLTPLKVVVYEMQKAEDGSIISSSRIRSGEIDREGKLFIKPPWLTTTLVLPQSLRDEFAKPFGLLIKDFNAWFDAAGIDQLKTATVGDIVTKTLNEKKFGQRVSVVDFKTHRKKKFETLSDLSFFSAQNVIKIKNPPGQISRELFQSLVGIFRKDSNETYVIEIVGEEDLAVLPLILAAPLDFTIIYGQPGEGVVVIKITEKNKEKAYQLATQFLPLTRGS